MRNHAARRLLENTPQATKDWVRKWAELKVARKYTSPLIHKALHGKLWFITYPIEALQVFTLNTINRIRLWWFLKVK